MLPEEQLGDDVESGRLVRLPGRHRIDVPLNWQRWRLRSARIDRVTAAVRAAAAPLHR